MVSKGLNVKVQSFPMMPDIDLTGLQPPPKIKGHTHVFLTSSKVGDAGNLNVQFVQWVAGVITYCGLSDSWQHIALNDLILCLSHSFGGLWGNRTMAYAISNAFLEKNLVTIFTIDGDEYQAKYVLFDPELIKETLKGEYVVVANPK